MQEQNHQECQCMACQSRFELCEGRLQEIIDQLWP